MAKKNRSEKTKIKLTKSTLKKSLQLYKYLAPHKGLFLIGLIFLFLTSATAVVFPKYMGQMLDAAKSSLSQDIHKVGITLFVIFLAQSVFSFFRIYLFTYVAEKALINLRTDVYGHIINLPMSFFNTRRVGELNSRISNDISLIQETFTTAIAEFLRQIIIIVGGIFFLFTISVKLTLFMLSIIPVVSILAVVFGKKIRSISKKTQDVLAESNVIVEESLQGVSVVKSFTNEFFEVNRYKTALQKVLELSINSAKWRGGFASFIIFCLFGSIISVVWYGSILVQNSSENLSLGDLVSFILYTVFIGASVGGIASLYTQILKAMGATETLFEIFDEVPEKIEPVTNTKRLNGEIIFSNVHFYYPNRSEKEVLKNIDITIKPGEKIALVGASGSGKSTIASLIFSFYTPTQGEILFDGLPQRNYSISYLRSQISIVPQDTLLFGGSIRENILYGKHHATEEELINAAKHANAYDFIMQLPNTWDTIVGERGIQLSGGQRQRIAIARAILKNPSILVLDEATSALDSESESLVQDALEKVMLNRTSIIIAHRLSTIKHCQQIIVLDKGQIMECGTHDELMKIEHGMYQKMVHLQSMELEMKEN